jgi:hypothetical protein
MSINATTNSATSLANLLQQYQVQLTTPPAASQASGTTASAPAATKTDSASFSPAALQALQDSLALQMLQGSSSNQATSSTPDLLSSLGLTSGDPTQTSSSTSDLLASLGLTGSDPTQSSSSTSDLLASLGLTGSDPTQTSSSTSDLLASLGLTGSDPTSGIGGMTANGLGLTQDQSAQNDPLTTLMSSYTATIVATDNSAVQAALARAGKTA